MNDDDTPATLGPPQEDDPVLRLIRKIQEGKDVEKSFEELHRIFYHPVLAFFQRRGFPLEEARDLTQAVFLRSFSGISTFQGRLRFERWLFKIAANIWKNELRWRGAEKGEGSKQSMDPLPEANGQEGESTEPVDSKQKDLDLIQARARQKLLWEALKELPPQMRRVCELRFVQDRKYQEIADLLGVSIETIKAHLHQARKRLISKLSPDSHPSLEDLESYRSGRLPRLREHVKACQFCSALLLELDRFHSPLGADPGASESEIDANWKELMDRELPLLVWRDFPSEAKGRFHSLIAKREEGTLSPEEQQELIRLSDQAERWQAEKLRALADLAASRGTSIAELLQELEAETSSR